MGPFGHVASLSLSSSAPAAAYHQSEGLPHTALLANDVALKDNTLSSGGRVPHLLENSRSNTVTTQIVVEGRAWLLCKTARTFVLLKYKPDPSLGLCHPENTVPQLRPVRGGPVRLLNHGEIQELLWQTGWGGLHLWVMIPKVTDIVSTQFG